jgi:cytochrome b pre-mRNA-processing protein 3
MLFYSKQSKSIRGANVIYDRITSQVDSAAIYDGTSSYSYPEFIVHFAFCAVSLSIILLSTKLKYAHLGNN